MKVEPAEGPERPFNYDVVDVSQGFLTRIPYKKKVKSSKLDCLLERRLKQHVIEERQRQQVCASSPQTSTPVSSASPSKLSTPVRPRSPLKSQTLAQTKLRLDGSVKVEKSSTTETPVLEEVGGQKVPSPVPGSTPKDNCSIDTGDDSSTPQNQVTSTQALKVDLEGRTIGSSKTNSERSEQDDIKCPDARENDGIHSSMEKQTKSEEANLKSNITRMCSTGFDQKSSPNTSPSLLNQQNAGTFSSVHPGAEKNGTGPAENQESMQILTQGKTDGDNTLDPVSPLPQVNGNDGSGIENILSNSVMASNNGVLPDSPQTRINSFGKGDEQGLAVSLKDNTQQKPLVNGDLTLASDSKEPTLNAETDQECKPLKMSRVDNNVEALEADTQSPPQPNSTSTVQPVETNTTPVFKIIRMAPSPIPSAEESSLSDDFTEENSQSGMTEPLKTIITQVTTTTTRTVVSTEKTTVKVPSESSGQTSKPVVSTSESSTVATLSTMTKTTMTKITSSCLDSQSEDSQSETVIQDQTTTVTSTAATSRKTSVSSVTVSQEDYTLTKGRVRLLKFSRTKKTRSDTALPSYCKFVTKSNRKSIFVLLHDDLRVLGRRGGFREVPIFNYNAKPAWDIWPYPSPRPTFGITWRYVCSLSLTFHRL